MNIKQEEKDGQGAFFIEGKDDRLAELTYYLQEPGLMVIDHTEVDETLRGKNIGGQLVQMGVEYARTNQIRIDPQCPFVRGVFEKSNEYDDVWK